VRPGLFFLLPSSCFLLPSDQICRLTGFPKCCSVGFKEIAVRYTLPSLDSRISNASHSHLINCPFRGLPAPSILVTIAPGDKQLRMLVQSRFNGNKTNLPQPVLRIRFSRQKLLHERVEHWHNCVYLFFRNIQCIES
jgi:hypothetical protein